MEEKRRKRILIIDDEEAFGRVLKLSLEQTGRYEVCVEPHGARGLATAQAFQPDLIFLDVIMPDLDGGHVAERLKTDPSLRSIPVIFLTAVVSREDLMAQAGLIGGRTFIAKPVSVKDLLQCIERHLEHQQPLNVGPEAPGT